MANRCEYCRKRATVTFFKDEEKVYMCIDCYKRINKEYLIKTFGLKKFYD